jgi:hypothetical protein
MERFRRWTPRAVALGGFAFFAHLAPVDLGGQSTSPLHHLVGSLARLLPLGEAALRMHLVSAAAGAIAMLLVARLVQNASPGDAAATVGGAAGALLCGVSLAFARQAAGGGDHVITAALAAGALILFDRVARGGDARSGLSLAFVIGLGLAAHPWFRVLVPLPLAILLAVRLRRGARWPLLVPLLAVATGAAVFLHVPVAGVATADRSPAAQVLDDVRARELRGPRHPREATAPAMAAAPALELATARARAARAVAGAADHLGVLGLIAALFGAAYLLVERRSRWLLLALGALAAGAIAGPVWLDASGPPLAVAVGALAGFGLATLARTSGPAGPAVAAAAAILIATGPLLITWTALAP